MSVLLCMPYLCGVWLSEGQVTIIYNRTAVFIKAFRYAPCLKTNQKPASIRMPDSTKVNAVKSAAVK